MNPVLTALVTAFLDAAIKGINDYLQAVQMRNDITDLEKQKAKIIGQGYVIAGQQWAIRALLDPDSHDFLPDLGGKLEPIVPANPTGSAVQPGVPP